MNANHKIPANNNTFVDTLLAIDGRVAISSAEGREIAKQILRRDQRRVQILTWLTIGFFLLTVIGICGGVSWFYWKITSWMNWYQQVMFELGSKISNQEALGSSALVTGQACRVLYMSQLATIGGLVVLLVIMLAAAFCTVLLIMASRRATLRQIQANLLVLSEQFDALKRSLDDAHSTGSNQVSNGGQA